MMKRRKAGIWSVLWLSAWLGMSSGAYAQVETKLTASDAAMFDWFGVSVSLSGERALVGAYHDDDACPSDLNCNSGSAYIFRYDGTTWVEEAKLTASDAAVFDEFGVSVSLSGERALVGAFHDRNSGSAYIFRYDGTTWVEEAKLTASDAAAAGKVFGSSVSLSGERALVADVGYTLPSIGLVGSAYIFRYDGTTWVEEAKLTASDRARDDFFGESVSLSGERALVGVSGDDDAGSSSGSAYIFRREGTTWVEEAKLTASDASAFDGFGVSVSLSGERALVAGGGAAYVFRYDGTTWVEEAKLAAGDGADGDAFGFSVSLSGERALVGAKGDDDACPSDPNCSSGSAYIFRRESTTWVEEAKLTASAAAARVEFGFSVSLSGDQALVGAWQDDDDSGSAYVYDLTQPVAIDSKASVPDDYALHPNYPNPFNPATKIRFDLPEASMVRLVVYDAMGREVARLVDGSLGVGRHAVRWEAGGCPVALISTG